MRARPTSRNPTPAEVAAARIHAAIAAIPRGRVSTYGWIAERAGLPRQARLVGRTLKIAPDALKLPWHRVVNAQGRISFPPGSGSHAKQRRLLEREGVVFLNGRIRLDRYGWRVSLDELLWKPDRRR